MTMFIVLSSRYDTATDPQTKPTDSDRESACIGCRGLYPPSPFVIISQPITDNHFTIPQRVKG